MKIFLRIKIFCEIMQILSCNIGARSKIKHKTGSVKQINFDVPALYTTRTVQILVRRGS